jgi:hypothetical protein
MPDGLAIGAGQDGFERSDAEKKGETAGRAKAGHDLEAGKVRLELVAERGVRGAGRFSSEIARGPAR